MNKAIRDRLARKVRRVSPAFKDRPVNKELKVTLAPPVLKVRLDRKAP